MWPWAIDLAFLIFSILIWNISKIHNLLNWIGVRLETIYEACLMVSAIDWIFISSQLIFLQLTLNKHNSQFLEFVNLWFNPGFAAECVTLRKPLSLYAPVLPVKGRFELYNLKSSTLLSPSFISSDFCSFKGTTSTKQMCYHFLILQ